jgi:hypothetical protein
MSTPTITARVQALLLAFRTMDRRAQGDILRFSKRLARDYPTPFRRRWCLLSTPDNALQNLAHVRKARAFPRHVAPTLRLVAGGAK